MSIISKLFDQQAKVYPADIGEDYVQNRKWKLVEKHRTTNGNAIDVGAATGRHTLNLGAESVDVVAVDPSWKMIVELTNSTKTLNREKSILPCVAGLPDLPFPSRSFDLVYCFSTLLLLSTKEQEQSLKELARLVRVNGVLVVDISNEHSLAIRYWRRHYRTRGLAGVFGSTVSKVGTILNRQQFEIVSTEAHGALTQFLLFPGLQHVPWLVRLVRGHRDSPGWDSVVSRFVPGLAERWFVVSRPMAINEQNTEAYSTVSHG